MAGNFNYNTPDDFSKDEEKWFKFFSLWSLLSTIVCGTIAGVIIIPIFAFFNQAFIGVLITLVFAAFGFAIVSFEIPVGTKLPGAGHTPITIMFRIFCRKLPWNKVIYVKGYGEYEDFYDDDEDESEE